MQLNEHRKEVCCTREVLHEMRVCESLLMLLTLLEIPGESEASDIYVSFVILTALSENKQVWVYSELFERLSQSVSNGCRRGHFHHCNRQELESPEKFAGISGTGTGTLSGLLRG